MDKILRFLIIFLGTYLLLQWLFPPQENVSPENKDDIEISFADKNPTVGNLIEITIANNLDTDLDLGKGTPPEKLFIEKYNNGEWIRLDISNEGETIIPAQTKQIFSYPDANTTFFNEEKSYKVRIEEGTKEFYNEFTLEGPGIFTTIWRTFFYKPIYNGLFGSLTITGFNLGLAIILLTLVIKLILFIPTQRGMQAQRKLQVIQPELEAIKSRHSGDQQRIAMETMELWKKHKVSPFASILPILLQFPVLIGLFYVIQEGLSPEKSFFLYSPLSNFNYDAIDTIFLGFMDLLKTPLQMLEMAWLPVLVAVVQYYAMKLAFSRMKKPDPKKKPEGFMGEFQAEFQKMNKVFIYVLPAFIGIFTFFMPAAVGLYWLISTAFSIGQQYIVNKDVDSSMKK